MTDSPKSVAYVSPGQIDARKPPSTGKGLLTWLRENLFSSPMNGLLTVVSILLVVWLIPQFFTWGVTNATVAPEEMSRQGCFQAQRTVQLERRATELGMSGLWTSAPLSAAVRQSAMELRLPAAEAARYAERLTVGREAGHWLANAVSGLSADARATLLAPALGESWGATEFHYGACWAVIDERLYQFTFGYYPQDEFWRPLLAFGLLLLAMAPVLFAGVPRALLLLTASYPAIGYFLIWGGNVWGPLLVLAAPLLAYLVWRGLSRIGAGGIAPFVVGVGLLLYFLYAVAGIDRTLTRVIGDMRYDGAVVELEETLAEIASAAEQGDEERLMAIVGLDESDLEDFSDADRVEAIRDAVTEERDEAQFLLTEYRSLLRQLEEPGRLEELERLRTEYDELDEKVERLIDELDISDAVLRSLDTPNANIAAMVGAGTIPTEFAEAWEERDRLAGQIPGLEGRVEGIYARLGLVGLPPVESEKLGGFLLVFVIGLVGIAGSLPIGILLALGRKSNLFVVRTISIMFIEFIRGVPLITLLFVANVLLAYFLPPGTDFDKLLRVLIMVTLFASAYMAEVIRGGLAALPQGQYEAADAMGLTYWQSMRLIILPQALKISIPGIVNTFIGLFKDVTLVSIIGLFDPVGIITPIRADSAWTGIYWEPFLFVAVFFFICCFAMSRYSMYLERKLATDRR